MKGSKNGGEDMTKIDDKDLQDVSGGGGQIKDLDSGGDSGSTNPEFKDAPTPGAPSTGNPLNPEGNQNSEGSNSEMGPG